VRPQRNPCRKATVTSAAQATWVPAGKKLIEPAWGWENSVQLKLSIALACVVAGCAQDVIPEPTPSANDKSAIELDCSGLLQGWNQCLLTASNTCGSRGYTILGRSDQNPAQPDQGAFTRSMLIRCNS